MMNREYKGRPFGFGEVKEGRILRSEKQQKLRKDKRAKEFSVNRKLENLIESIESSSTIAESDSGVQDRMAKLLKWKAEKERQKKLAQLNKRPPFIAGIVHHKQSSPYSKPEETGKPCNHSGKRTQSSPVSKRVTRATAKRMQAKALSGTQNVRININGRNKKPLTKKAELKEDEVNADKKNEHRCPLVPSDYTFKVPQTVAALPSFSFGKVPMIQTPPIKQCKVRLSPVISRHILTDTFSSSKEAVSSDLEIGDLTVDSGNCTIKSPEIKLTPDKEESLNKINKNATIREKEFSPVERDAVYEPICFSPYVVSSRGKSNARKEQQMRRDGRHFSSGEVPNEDTAQYFKFILNKETLRLTELCQNWTDIMSSSNITEEVQYTINQAIGQTSLLLKKKLQKFRQLVEDCENGDGEMLVTCKDLQGFWDLTYMEIQDCDSRFNKLEKLRMQNWQEDEEQVMAKPVKRKAVQKKKMNCPAKSSFQDFIKAARKKQAKERNKPKNLNGRRSSDSFKAELTPNKNTSANSGTRLLRAVQLSEASKKVRSPLIQIESSNMSKAPKVELDNSITYINSDHTPAKSILKRAEKSIVVKSCTRSGNKVNFDKDLLSDKVSVDEDEKVNGPLVSSESNLPKAPIPKRSIKRQLAFETDTFSGSENELKDKTGPITENVHEDESDKISTKLLLPMYDDMNITPRRSQNYDKVIYEVVGEANTSTRILRNRTIIADNTPRSRRKSVKASKKEKENESPTTKALKETSIKQTNFVKNYDSQKEMKRFNNLSIDERNG